MLKTLIPSINGLRQMRKLKKRSMFFLSFLATIVFLSVAIGATSNTSPWRRNLPKDSQPDPDSMVEQICAGSNYIGIVTDNNIQIYDFQGKFLHKLSVEITDGTNFVIQIFPDDRIGIISSRGSSLRFIHDIDGKYLEEQEVPYTLYSELDKVKEKPVLLGNKTVEARMVNDSVITNQVVLISENGEEQVLYESNGYTLLVAVLLDSFVVILCSIFVFFILRDHRRRKAGIPPDDTAELVRNFEENQDNQN